MRSWKMKKEMWCEEPVSFPVSVSAAALLRSNTWAQHFGVYGFVLQQQAHMESIRHVQGTRAEGRR